ncbi:TRADD-N-associated membrane domain-containing protein [Chryseobacterium sp. Mn2064]|uniref:TRADD-N-associated membrane domain-containing protein n=1 Tax=Chryseobacterium sp. Mn2064 TaxID=3395263 RepID=UPI003BE9A94B
MIDLIRILEEPFKQIGAIIKQNTALKRYCIVMLIFFGLTTFGILIYSNVFVHVSDVEEYNFLINGLLPFFAVPFGLLLFILYFSIATPTPSKEEQEIIKINVEREEIKTKIESKNQLEIFDTIQLSLNQLNEYYTINKAQAKSSFNWSILAIVLGLTLIIAGIILFYTNTNPNINITILTGIAGILLEFIGGAYFIMYKKSLEQVNFFFAQLIKVQDTMLSINLANKVEDDSKKTEMTEKIIVSLLERSLK